MTKLKKDGTISKQGEGAIGSGQPLKFKEVDSMILYAENFFEWCEITGQRPTVTRLAYYLDCSKQTLYNYENAEEKNWLKRLSDEDRKRYVDSIKKIKRRIEAEYEDALFDKKSVTGAIFTLKNNYGWVDKQEIVNTTNTTEMTKEEIEQRLEELKG